ncbi:MAG: helix-turn-helix domain-containing protein [Chloroflexi bacterium]|nr:helix-turn-helix domain-containing protein [Chloroflexota bacterium]
MTTSTADQRPSSKLRHAPEPTPIAARVAANRWRNSLSVRERLMKVAGLRQRGLSQTAIAGRLGVSEATISRDLRRLELLWRQEHAHLGNAERLRSLASLREAERHCWQLIEKHEGDAERIAMLNGVRSNLTAIQREIRALLEHVRPPHPHDYWGYETIASPLRSLDALEERHEPPARVIVGLQL